MTDRYELNSEELKTVAGGAEPKSMYRGCGYPVGPGGMLTDSAHTLMTDNYDDFNSASDELRNLGKAFLNANPEYIYVRCVIEYGYTGCYSKEMQFDLAR